MLVPAFVLLLVFQLFLSFHSSLPLHFSLTFCVFYYLRLCISPLSSLILFPYVSRTLLFLRSFLPYSLLPFHLLIGHALLWVVSLRLASPPCHLLSFYLLPSHLFPIFPSQSSIPLLLPFLALLSLPLLSSPLHAFPLLSLRYPLFYHIAFILVPSSSASLVYEISPTLYFTSDFCFCFEEREII